MRSAFIVLLVACASQPTTPRVVPPPAPRCGGDEASAVRTIQDLYAALASDDVDAAGRLFAADFHAFDAGKPFTGPGLLGLVKEARAAGKKFVWNVTSPQTHLACDVAWLAWENRGSITEGANKQEVVWHESAVLRWSGAAWRIAFFHSSRAAAPPVSPEPRPAAAPAPTVTVRPAPAYVERTDGGQVLHVDLVIANPAPVSRKITRFQVTVHDASGAIAYRRFIDGNGVSPAILTIPNRDVPANGTNLLLNPLPVFPNDLDLARVRFDIDFEDAGSASVEVAPVVYRNRASLQLPLRGRLIVWDGHDLLAHHRRWDYLFEPIRAFGFVSNAARYSYDLVPVDAAGAMAHGDEARNESWIGFRAPVVAPADGTVVALTDDQLDDRKFEMADLARDLMVVYGNRIVIDHGNGEHSVLAHLAHRSAKVKLGDRVRAGQVIAAIGASGSAMFPHLHYQLQTSATGTAEGLPSYFHAFTRIRGKRRTAVISGQIDSGEIIESK